MSCFESSKNFHQLNTILEGYPGHTKKTQEDGASQLFFTQGTAKLDDINSFCFSKGISLQTLYLKKKSLETKFFELTN